MWAALKLSINLKDVAFVKIHPFVVVRYDGATPNLRRCLRPIIPESVVVFFDCSCATALTFCAMPRYTAVVELIVADNKAGALITVNRSPSPIALSNTLSSMKTNFSDPQYESSAQEPFP